MRGHIRKAGDGAYDCIVHLGRDPVTGKKKYKWRRVRGTKKEAEAYLNRVLREMDSSTYVEPGKTTFADLLRRWMEHVVEPSGRAGSTKDQYRYIVNHYLIPALGGHRLDRLSPTAFQEFYAHEVKGGLDPRTVKHHHTVARMALQQALEWGLVTRNPAALAKPPAKSKDEERGSMRVWSQEEVHAFLAAARKHSYFHAFYAAALGTGMRISELRGLRWGDVAPDYGALYVRQSLLKDGRRVEWGAPKTKRGERAIDLPRWLQRVLREHRTDQAKERLQWGEEYRPGLDLVFTVPGGAAINRANVVNRDFLPLMEKAKVPRIPFHSLRHTHATLLLKAAVHPKIVSERLGHASIQITLDTYSHVVPGMQRPAVEALDKLFGAPRARI